MENRLAMPRTRASTKRSGEPSRRTTRSWQTMPPNVVPFHAQKPM